MTLIPTAPARTQRASERIGQRRRAGTKLPPGVRTEPLHFERQCAAVEQSFEQREFEHDAVVVNAITAANRSLPVSPGIPIEADARAEVIPVLPALRRRNGRTIEKMSPKLDRFFVFVSSS